MSKGLNLVSNEVRDLAFLAAYEEKISRLRLEMTIPSRGGRSGGLNGALAVERNEVIERFERIYPNL
jgi:hypothetical protein